MSQWMVELATLMTIFAFVIVSPGADFAMVMRQAIVHGRKAAVVSSIGIGVSLLFHISYTILGLGLLIAKSILLFNIVKWCGVAYLVYIGVQSLRAGFASPAGSEAVGTPRAKEGQSQSMRKAFLLGFAANALNPKPVFFFLSVFATVVSPHTAASAKFGYGVVMASSLILWFVGVSYFMTTERMRAAFSRAAKWIDRTSGVVFIALGLKLAGEKAA